MVYSISALSSLVHIPVEYDIIKVHIIDICGHEGCTQFVQKNGLCTKHFNESVGKPTRWLDDSNSKKIGGKRYRICEREGCTQFSKKNGLCKNHFNESVGKPTRRSQTLLDDSNSRKRSVGGRRFRICEREGCTQFVQKNGGLCTKHFNESVGNPKRRSQTLLDDSNSRKSGGGGRRYRICEREGCTQFSKKNGLCKNHFNESDSNMRCGTWEIQLIIMLYLYPLNNGRGSNKGEIMDYLEGKGLTVGGGQAECVLINLYEEMKYIDMNTRSATTGMASGASAAASATTGGEGMATEATGGEETASCLWEGRHYHGYRNGKGGIVI